MDSNSLYHKPLNVFFSYAQEDADYLALVKKHLLPLKRDGIIEIWEESQILAGSVWTDMVQEALLNADICIFLISADWLASDQIYDIAIKSLERNKNEGVFIIPIIIKPCAWESSPLDKFQHLPKNGQPVSTWNNPDEALAEISKGVFACVEMISKKRKKTVADSPDPARESKVGGGALNDFKKKSPKSLKVFIRYFILLLTIILIILAWRVINDKLSGERVLVSPDGKRYSTVRLNNLTWMAENLSSETPGSVCYEGAGSTSCAKYGRLYTKDSARKACAALGKGWRLPTEKEWGELAGIYGGLDASGNFDRKEAFRGLFLNGESKFNAQLAGQYVDGKYQDIDTVGYYWAISVDNFEHTFNFYGIDEELYKGTIIEVEPMIALSCRCVKK